MTDQPLLSPPDEPSEPTPVVPNPPHRDLVPWLYGLGFVVLAVAIVYLWQYPSMPDGTANDASAIHTVEQRLADIDARLTRLEQRPTADLAKITARVDALDGRVADQTQVAIRLDTLSGRLDALLRGDQAGLDSTKQQLDALTNRVNAIEANAGNVDAMTKRLNRIARLQEASFALASGQPIGDLPNAPEALTRFAHVAPPTEAQLRLRFPRDEETALAAKQPGDSDAPFIGRVWERVQGLVTIRRGDNIVVGNPTAVALDHARVALDAGDLAAAADAVGALKGQPSQAMANWLADAKALLNARSALAHMADQA
jgi:hypothetical protein